MATHVARLKAVGALVGWAWLASMIAGMLAVTDMATLGPGMGLLNRINGFADFGPEVRAALTVLCGPAGASWTLAEAGAVFAMWVAMVLAMMLPSAAPVLTSYARLAEAKQRNGLRTASPVVLAAGYLAIWVGFAGAATLAQALLTRLSVLTPVGLTASELLAGTTMIAAGLYQFSPLKLGCLARCRNPAPYFADNWTPRSLGIFRQGIEQGLDCLGCCWALMVVMFAVGVMNVVWIAVLGAVMTIEKLTTSLWVSRAIGLVFVEEAAFHDTEIGNLTVMRVDAEHDGKIAGRLGHQLGRFKTLARRAVDNPGRIGPDHPIVLQCKSGRGLARLAQIDAVGGFLGFHNQVAYAHLLDERHHFLASAGADGHHGNYRCHAEDHAQHGEQGAQFVPTHGKVGRRFLHEPPAGKRGPDSAPLLRWLERSPGGRRRAHGCAPARAGLVLEAEGWDATVGSTRATSAPPAKPSTMTRFSV